MRWMTEIHREQGKGGCRLDNSGGRGYTIPKNQDGSWKNAQITPCYVSDQYRQSAGRPLKPPVRRMVRAWTGTGGWHLRTDGPCQYAVSGKGAAPLPYPPAYWLAPQGGSMPCQGTQEDCLLASLFASLRRYGANRPGCHAAAGAPAGEQAGPAALLLETLSVTR